MAEEDDLAEGVRRGSAACHQGEEEGVARGSMRHAAEVLRRSVAKSVQNGQRGAQEEEEEEEEEVRSGMRETRHDCLPAPGSRDP
eukprot:1195398-Pyramimonas_sp.AAC.1